MAEGPKPVLTRAWEVELPSAETAAFDPGGGVLYVTGMGEKPGTGTTWKLSTQGDILARDWATGLDRVRGSKLAGGFLFVAELQGLARIDLATGGVVKRYPAPEAGMFNNIAMDPEGNLYVTDTPGNAIYRWDRAADSLSRWLESPKLEWPNGIFYEDGFLVAAPWGTVTDPATWATPVPGRLQRISLRSKSIELVDVDGTPLANGDGLVGDGKGNYFVGDWMSGKIYLVSRRAERTELLTVHQGIGDFTYLPSERLLIVPCGKIDRVIAYRVSG
jgi:sugar lactone lactonase YvrE